jgi:maltooligosyltrehalose trehalohydrolase
VQAVFGATRSVVLDLRRDSQGYFEGSAADAETGMNYSLRLDDAPQLRSDPASRFQPEGSRGPSQIVDAGGYVWSDQGWPGVTLDNQVLYEMHVGTFTPQGTWRAAADELAELAALGITALEIMPIAEFPGKFGWSYDGTHLFAPSHRYGAPDEFRYFVDVAHQVGLGVLLDVVYNHWSRIGEEVVRPFSDAYVSTRHKNDWGAAVNFDGEESQNVREFFLANVRHWISEYHVDGLRIDATQAFNDESPRSILLEMGHAARESAAGRSVLVIGENEPQLASLLRPETQGGCELDALWNDDFHHSAMVRLTGRREAYYTDYCGSAEELVAAVKWGFLYQGQRYSWQKNPRGTSALDIPAPRFINFLQNHDQMANSARGQRIHQQTSPGRYRAMTALLLLAPQTPLLFQGQEFAASSPFLYFNDVQSDETRQVAQGRARFLSQFPSLAQADAQRILPNPALFENFERCKLDLGERERHVETYALHRDLLRLRRQDVVLREHDASYIHGFTLSSDALGLRFQTSGGATRLLVVNLGADLDLASVSQPLIAPPDECRWAILWSSESPQYGGAGAAELDTPQGWHIPAEAATVLHPVESAKRS